MTELQVKTKKGSLKKFLAMFLAVCVCMTTFQLNGMFASATGGSAKVSDVTPEIAMKPEIKLNNNVTADLAEKAEAVWTPNDAVIDWTADNAAAGVNVSIKNGIISPGDATDFSVNVTGTVRVEGKGSASTTVKVTFGEPDDGNGGGGNNGTTVAVTGVSLNKTTLTLTEEGSETLTATVLPSNATNKAVTWASSNANVATVAAGKVTAVAKGTANITVTTVDGKKTATCKVTVNPKTTTPTTKSVTGVSLDKTSLTLNVKGTATLTPTVAPADATNKAVTWASSNTKVATVSGGKVTAVAKGTANITVTTVDGKKTATCKVTVKQPVTSVKLSAKTIYLVTKKSVTVGVSVAPLNANNKAVTWKSKKTSIATVDKNGKITAKNKVGTAKITATAKDGSKKSATVTVNVVKKATKATKVTVSKTANVNVGGTVALQPKLTPAKATSTLTWSTSDKKVATVENGVVTGKKAGKATITVKADKKSAKCVVTVTKEGVKAQLKKTSGTVKVKKTLQIQLKNTKAGTIKECKTSNKKVATVTNKGKITGKKAGKAEITVITSKGGVATFTVTVKK